MHFSCHLEKHKIGM